MKLSIYNIGTLKKKLNIYRHVSIWFQKLKKEDQDKINFFLNYILNSVPISVCIYIVMGIWLDFTFSRYVLTYIATVTGLPYIEHYLNINDDT